MYLLLEDISALHQRMDQATGQSTALRRREDGHQPWASMYETQFVSIDRINCIYLWQHPKTPHCCSGMNGIICQIHNSMKTRESLEATYLLSLSQTKALQLSPYHSMDSYRC